VAPVDELTRFAAVPSLGVVKVQAPAVQLASLFASATHARLVCVECAYQGFSSGYDRFHDSLMLRFYFSGGGKVEGAGDIYDAFRLLNRLETVQKKP
jgi:hypothetical protein